MREPPKSSVLLLTAGGLAILADSLFRNASWGINIGIWALAFAATIAVLARRSPLRLRHLGPLFGVAVVGFALLFALRDSNTLKLANGIALSLCLGAMLLPVAERSIRESSVGELLGGVLHGLGLVPAGAAALAATAKDVQVGSAQSRARNQAIGRGLLLATPLLLLFGGLFASADVIFRRKFENLFRFDLDFGALSQHVWTLLLGVIVAAGLLHRTFLWAAPKAPVVPPRPGIPDLATAPEISPFAPPTPTPPPDPAPEQVVEGVPASTMPIPPVVTLPTPRPSGWTGLGITEIGVVLGSLVLLFGSFLAVQFRYLFGAADTVRATVGLSYAEYARGGFFELVWVAALALVVILGAGALLRREGARDDAVYRWLGRVLVAMVFLIVESAMLRMKLYTDAFGLTELRIYSSVFMGWLTLAFGWMLLSTLSGRPKRFAFGAFAAGLLTIFLTNVLNPDRFIVRTNLSRPHADFAYLKTLSDDAVLALSQMRPLIPAAHRAEAEALIARRKTGLATGDWREGNVARWSLSH